MILYNKYFQITLIASIALLWLSLFGFLYPAINNICFILIVLATLILSWRKLEYGAYLILAELFLTSHGHLFNFGPLSLRMALFAVTILVWLAKKDYKFKISKSYYLLLVVLLWGLGWGIYRNNFSDAFNDFNGYLYLLLLPVFLTAFKDKQNIKNIFPIFLGSLSAMVFFNLVQLFFFTHKISNDLLWPIYRWTRVNYLGEITYAGSGFYRIFWPGQFFLIVGFFLLLALAVYGLKNRKQTIGNTILASLFLSGILISFSRSFWLAMIIALFFLMIFFIKKKVFLKSIIILILICLLSVGIIYSTVKFPAPPTIGDFSAEMLKNRAGTFISSRWNLLPVLSKALVNHPVVGSGFGSSLTYKTEDPRLLEFFPDGNYTTYAFEWGYLELIFKIGLAGLLAYLLLIWQIGKKTLANLLASTGEEKFVLMALMAGLIALLVTHNFSPYLNHPIGIGYLLLLIII